MAGEWLRLLFALVFCGSFAAFMMRTIWLGFKTGKMPHSDSRAVACRRKQPLFFWFLFFLFGGFAAAALYTLYLAVLNVL
ncbi:MAG TPA: hypothetical protein PLX33_08410 [Alphaproteobacteria bacterium]|nr:hypothetical protein [Alphaproteobacteria bacterium]